MFRNDAIKFIDQQCGFSRWRESDVPIKRLRCLPTNSFSQLFPESEPVEVYGSQLYRDTPIFTCKFSPLDCYEHLVAMANEDGKLAIHNCDTNHRHGVQAHNNAVFDLAWVPDECKVVTASGDHTLKLYDVGDGDIRNERVFCGHTRSVKTVAFRRTDPSVFATGGRDGSIIVWDMRMNLNSYVGKPDHTICSSHVSRSTTPGKSKKKFYSQSQNGVKSVTGLVFQGDDTLISCGAGDGLIKIWDLRKNYVTYKKRVLPKAVIPYSGVTTKNGFSSLLIDDAGIRLYASCLDNTIYCYNAGTYSSEPLMRYTGHQNSTFYIKSSLNKTGEYLVSGSSDNNAYVWNTRRPTPIVKLTGHTAEVTCVAWCGRDNILLTCSDDITHMLWTVASDPNEADVVSGRAEVLPARLPRTTNPWSKRALLDCDACAETSTPKKFLYGCCRCDCASATRLCCRCEPYVKRKSETDLEPKRLFGVDKTEPLARYLDENDDPSEYEPRPKAPKTAVEPPDEELEPRTKMARLEITPRRGRPEVDSSPTSNLPNFVVDGVAPHLMLSPPKKKCQDWLTKLRVEKRLQQEMYDRTVGQTTPRHGRPETQRRAREASAPRSPLLRYFRVTNNSPKCEGLNCSKFHNCGGLVQESSTNDLRQSDN